MKTSQFQADRREALRRQLIELPGLAGAKDPVRYRPGKDANLRRPGIRQNNDSVVTLKPDAPARPRPTRRILLTAAAVTVGALDATGETPSRCPWR